MAIRKVGVVGCGLMGAGIAQVCAEAGYSVRVREVSDDLLSKGLGRIEAFLKKGVEKGKSLARAPQGSPRSPGRHDVPRGARSERSS